MRKLLAAFVAAIFAVGAASVFGATDMGKDPTNTHKATTKHKTKHAPSHKSTSNTIEKKQ